MKIGGTSGTGFIKAAGLNRFLPVFFYKTDRFGFYLDAGFFPGCRTGQGRKTNTEKSAFTGRAAKGRKIYLSIYQFPPSHLTTSSISR
jgi:hypothetical protein